MFIYKSHALSESHFSHNFLRDELKPELFTQHIHSSCELLLIVTCHGADYNIRGNVYPIGEYDLLLIPAQTYHFLMLKSYEKPYENYCINFDPALLDSQRLEQLFSAPYIYNIQNDTNIKRMFASLDYFDATYAQQDFYEAADNMLRNLLIDLSYKEKRSAQPHEIPSYVLVRHITAFIENNLEKELNSEIIAKEMQFSKSYIQNTFASIMGIGIQTYINQKKIYAARSDIQNGLTPVCAANKYAYGDYSSFYRQFKKHLAALPQKTANGDDAAVPIQKIPGRYHKTKNCPVV